jgi:hypothetical protein
MEAKGDDAGSWTVRVRNIPLRPGDNRLTLQVRNDDDECVEPGRQTVFYKQPPKPPAKATVEMIEPDRPVVVVHEPRCPVSFRVRSTSKADVGLLLNGRPIPVGEPGKEGNALVYRLTVSNLQPGNNTLQAVVRNQAGRSESPQRIISYPPAWMVRVAPAEDMRLERQDKPGTFLPLSDEAPGGSVWLHGYVEWREATQPSLRTRERLRVWVNDFEQFDVQLGPANKLRRAFKASLRLNQKLNLVRLQLPAHLKVESNRPIEFPVSCARPEAKQRLHLVILGPGQSNQQRLIGAVLKAFLASNIKGKSFRTPAFDEGIVYRPSLGGNVDRDGVETLLLNLKDDIGYSSGKFNDVVVVFFSGVEVVQGSTHYLLTVASQKRGKIEETALVCDRIREILSDCRGAKLLLLDVRNKPGKYPDVERPLETTFPHLGLYRYVWLGGDDPPEKARLVHALEQSLSRAPLVKDQIRHLEGWARGLGKKALFDPFCPPGLQRLRLGPEKGK